MKSMNLLDQESDMIYPHIKIEPEESSDIQNFLNLATMGVHKKDLINGGHQSERPWGTW